MEHSSQRPRSGAGAPVYRSASGTVVGARARLDLDAYSRLGRAISRPRIYYSAAFAILLVALLLRVWNLGGASLWSDEALTALRAQAPLRDSFASVAGPGNQTPVYFWFLRLFPTSTEALLRLPGALLGVLGVAVFMLVVRRLYQHPEMALWAGALLAVNPFHVWLSRTARPYSMMFLLALLSSYFFLLLLRGHRSRGVWIAYVLTSMVTYIAHFTALALPAAQYIVFGFVLRREVKFFRRWTAAQVVAAAPSLMWVYIMLTAQGPKDVKSHWIPEPTLRDIPLSLWNMTLGYDGVFKWTMVPALMLVTLGLVFGLSTAIAQRRRNLDNFYWLWLIVAPLIPVFLLSYFAVSIYVDRYFTVFLPAVILLAMVGWMHYSPRWWRPALAVILATGAYTVIVSFHSGSYHRDDWRSAAAYVAEGFRPGDAIVLDRENSEETFARYYEGADFVPGAPPDSPDPIVLLSQPEQTAEVERSAARLWVVYRNPIEDVHRINLMPDFDPFDPTLGDMGRWLSARQDEVVEQRTYNGVRVLLLVPHGAQAVSVEP